jgi:phosphatidylserine decarboxylase
MVISSFLEGAIFFAVVTGVLFLLFYRFIFMRNPPIKVPGGNAIVSPADGRVMGVTSLEKKEILIHKGWLGKVKQVNVPAKKCYLVSIFMSPVHVHYNRSPLAGRVEQIAYHRGTFYNAGHPEKSLLNENNQITLSTVIGKIVVIQIAGFLARRIECHVKKNQNVNKGDNLGFINLGSQVSVLLPKDKVRMLIKEGDHVTGGETIIAEVI